MTFKFVKILIHKLNYIYFKDKEELFLRVAWMESDCARSLLGKELGRHELVLKTEIILACQNERALGVLLQNNRCLIISCF